MTEREFLDRLASLRRAHGSGAESQQKAPHKPLLLLILLSGVERSPATANSFSFQIVREEFDRLWPRFGWNSKTRAALPFWHLTGDGLWEIEGHCGVIETKGTKPLSDTQMNSQVKHGAFAEGVWQLIVDRRVRRRSIDFLIEKYFIPSVRFELRADLRLDWEATNPDNPKVERSEMRGRSPAEQARFRGKLLLAYDGRCAVCGFGPRHDRAPAAIDAAHIWPVEDGGPTIPQNGLALCKLHHWAIESGTMAFEDDTTILVSKRVQDGPTLDAYVRKFSRQKLRKPLSDQDRPGVEYLGLHRKNRFVGEAI